jgi:uncharacterized protein involved in outer membrane biogenesis
MVKPFRLAMDDGFVNGTLDLRSRGKTAIVEMVLNSDQFDLGRVLEGLGIHHVLEGKADIDINFKGRGNSTASLMAGLNGKTTVIMKDGRINNKFVKLFGSDLSSDFFALLKASSKKSEYTPINCFVSGWDIRNGLAETTALLMDTSEVSVTGYGRINLKTEALDLSFNPTPKKGVGIKGLGKLNLSLGGLTEPFKLKGTLSKPSLAIDPTGTMVTLGKAIGGAVLFGPLGIAAAMAGGELGDKNPCLVAIDVAKKGVDDKKSKRKKNVFQGATGDFER